MHLFYAQGGGLGHLTRIDAIIKTYQIPHKKVVIMSPSIFSKYFNYKFIELSWDASPVQWTEALLYYAKHNNITSFYVDAFPYGLKGELEALYKWYPDLNYIYISRILKWEYYLKNINATISPKFSKTLLLERLYDSHLEWIREHSKKIEQGKKQGQTNLKQKNFQNTPYIIIAHSGGKKDVQKLCDFVIKQEDLNGDVNVLVFTQIDLEIKHPKFKIQKNTYPIYQYFEKAIKIYTGCGFNVVRELNLYRNKHIMLPFKKLYDDQFFRYKTQNMNTEAQNPVI